MKDNRNKYAICPFFRGAENNYILCGPTGRNNIKNSFGDPDTAREFMRRHCCERIISCPIYGLHEMGRE